MEIMTWLWIAVCVLLVILEATTAMLVCIWFVGGSAAALIVSLCGGPVWLQVVLFIAVSIGLLLLLRPFLKKQSQNTIKTNVDAEIGKKGIVVESIDNLHGTGRIQVGGMDWAARSMDDSVIEAGAQVEICEIKGVRAYVKPVEAPVVTG